MTSRDTDDDHVTEPPAPEGDRAEERPTVEGDRAEERPALDGDLAAEHPAQAARPAPGRVVISSVTGKPIAWDTGRNDPTAAPAPTRRPILPDRVREDEPEPGADESNDARIAGEIPPHWGHGR